MAGQLGDRQAAQRRVEHFRDVAYADILVTQDADFLEVARLARTALRMLTFDEFARKTLALAPTLGIV